MPIKAPNMELFFNSIYGHKAEYGGIHTRLKNTRLVKPKSETFEKIRIEDLHYHPELPPCLDSGGSGVWMTAFDVFVRYRYLTWLDFKKLEKYLTIRYFVRCF